MRISQQPHCAADTMTQWCLQAFWMAAASALWPSPCRSLAASGICVDRLNQWVPFSILAMFLPPHVFFHTIYIDYLDAVYDKAHKR